MNESPWKFEAAKKPRKKGHTEKQQTMVRKLMVLRHVTDQRAMLKTLRWITERELALDVSMHLDFIDSYFATIEEKVRDKIARIAPNSKIAEDLKEYRARKAREKTAL